MTSRFGMTEPFGRTKRESIKLISSISTGILGCSDKHYGSKQRWYDQVGLKDGRIPELKHIKFASVDGAAA